MSDEIDQRYQQNTEEGLAQAIIGSPCITYQGEPFWGQDRFALFEDAILSGRAAYQP